MGGSCQEGCENQELADKLGIIESELAEISKCQALPLYFRKGEFGGILLCSLNQQS